MISPDMTTARRFALISAFALAFSPLAALAQATGVAAGGPILLFNPASAGAAQQLSLNDNSEGSVTYEVTKDGVDMTVVANPKTGFPGLKITPPTPWNALGFGHVETKVTNNGTKPFRANLVLYNEGTWQEKHSNANIITVKPGKTETLSAIFGYDYNQGGYQLDASKIIRALIFIGKSDVEQKVHFTGLVAAGPLNEKPVIPGTVTNPANVAIKPVGGVILGGASVIDPKQVSAKGGKISVADDKKSLVVDFSGKDQAVTFKPLIGRWNLNTFLQVHVKVLNTGKTPLDFSGKLDSAPGNSELIRLAKPIAPGAEGELIIPFQASTPAVLPNPPEQNVLEGKKNWEGSEPGTGTTYRSNVTTDLVLTSDKASSAQSFKVVSITATLPIFTPPSWLGKKPPVPGDWVQTLNEDFNGNSIDLHRWNIYSLDQWHIGAQTHFSKDNVIVKDGKLILRLEAKRGHHNDNPEMLVNDYATGYADTYGKWTQRYGYYETRMKFPTAPQGFFAFWMMPDRGIEAEKAGMSFNDRIDTKKGGMEFDIQESLAIWGPYRHDFGMHWDSYVKYHKSNGVFSQYVTPDKDGFVTIGMLWEPGKVTFYDDGVETGSWTSPRVSSVQEAFILDFATGGWETEPMDDKQLPADLVFDYIRVWQRKDWATPEDGAHPNSGKPVYDLPPDEAKKHPVM